MSKKDFDRYYLQVQDQYMEMLGDLEELSSVASESMVSQQIIDNIKTTLEPIKRNYMTLSYVSFLLNKPTRAKKLDKYIKQNKKLLDKSGNRKDVDVIKENKEQLDKIKEEISNI